MTRRTPHAARLPNSHAPHWRELTPSLSLLLLLLLAITDAQYPPTLGQYPPPRQEAPRLFFPWPAKQLPDRVDVKELDELLIHAPRLWVAEPPVLVEDCRQGPSLQLAQAPNQTARAMLSLVAMDEHRVISSVEHRDEGSSNLVVWDLHKGLLVARDAVLEKGDAFVIEEARILLWVLFEDQGEDAAQPERLEEFKVLLLGEAAAIEPRVDHGKVVWWLECLELLLLEGSHEG